LALRGEASLHVDSLWIAGGLYGNPFALHSLIEAYARDSGAKVMPPGNGTMMRTSASDVPATRASRKSQRRVIWPPPRRLMIAP
jgi:hypothetical protein